MLALCCMLLLLPTATLASTTPENTAKVDESILDQYLDANGYPQEIIDSFDSDLKELLYNEKCTFVGAQTESALVQDGVAPLGSDLDYYSTFVLSRVSSAPAGLAQFRISYSWVLPFAPFNNYVDKVAVAWETGWKYVNYSQEWRYYAHSGDYYSMQSGTNYDASAVTGIATKHDIIGGFTNWDGQYVSSDSHSGWLAVTVQQSLAGKGGPDSIGLLGRYFHQVLPFEGSVTIGAAQLSITLPSCYSWNTNPLYTFDFNWDDF